MMMLMLLSYGIGWKKMATLLPRHVRKPDSKSFFESINSTKKKLKKKPKTHFKNSSLISGLSFFVILFYPKQWSCKPDTNRSENRSLQYS